jgi:hypothetical protein
MPNSQISRLYVAAAMQPALAGLQYCTCLPVGHRAHQPYNSLHIGILICDVIALHNYIYC